MTHLFNQTSDEETVGLPESGLDQFEPDYQEFWPSLPGGVVKSAGRALQILEFFDGVRKSANVTEISIALCYPQSSTSTLLKSLVKLGYLAFDGKDRTFRPTNRVRLLGSWVDEPLFRDIALPKLMHDLNQETSELIVLTARNGPSSQIIHVVHALTRLRVHSAVGSSCPLPFCATGWVLLSKLPDLEVAKIARRVNAESASAHRSVNVPQLLEHLREVRERGYAFSTGLEYSRGIDTPGVGIIAMPIPEEHGQAPLAIAICGPVARMEARRPMLIELLKHKISEQLGKA